MTDTRPHEVQRWTCPPGRVRSACAWTTPRRRRVRRVGRRSRQSGV